MRNHWVSAKTPMATWKATLTPLQQAPERLVDWVAATVEAGEAERVYTVHEAAFLGYRRAEHGPLAPFLVRRYREHGELHVFDFWHHPPDRPPGFRVTADIAYFDPSGALVVEPVDDLGALARRLHPAETAARAPTSMKSRPPLAIDGTLGPLAVRELAVAFAVHSDIWLPWIVGWLEEGERFEPCIDNRPLARVNAPRLDRFLAAAKAATLAAGGAWEVDWEASRGHLAYAIRDDGIDVDAPRPDPGGEAAQLLDGVVERVQDGARRQLAPAQAGELLQQAAAEAARISKIGSLRGRAVRDLLLEAVAALDPARGATELDAVATRLRWIVDALRQDPAAAARELEDRRREAIRSQVAAALHRRQNKPPGTEG